MKDSRRKVLWGFGILAVACPCTLCGLGFYAFRSIFAGPAEDLPAQLAAARKEGLPLEPDDLRPHPPIAADRNAATVYRGFFPHIERAFKSDRKLTLKIGNVLNDRASPEELKEVSAIIESQRESLNEVSAASRRPQCDFALDYEKGFMMQLPEFAQAKNAIRLLVCRAYFRSRAGQLSDALDDVSSAQRIGVNMSDSPILIAALVRISIEATAVVGLDHCIADSKGNAAMLRKCQSVLDEFGAPADLRSAFKGELVLGRVTIRTIRSFGELRAMADSGEGGSPPSSSLTIPSVLREAFESKFVAEWRRVLAGMPADPADWQAAELVLDRTDKEVEADHSLTNAVNAVLFPVLSQTALAVGKEVARRNIAATAIRLMQDHLRTGAFPASLPNFGEISKDPFDGKPLRYRREGDGFTLYSIDSDREDNGGMPPKGTRKGDIVRTFR